MNKVYVNIKRLRTEHKISMADMADRIGINQSSYFQLEKGETKVTIERLEQIAEIFGLSVCNLLEEKSSKNVSENEQNIEFQAKIEALENQIQEKDLAEKSLKEKYYETIEKNNKLQEELLGLLKK